ncbi:hypothetical protein AVEN_249991-1 [Araneus ventricosus]|uniref:Uncharacterized protein n=1 Tax=Araneus ventricosus TaxID=182803 RepID=A0A4Y2LP39_ARAVE|nr:hypothetical protein AVEN_249991-1 [Araneus ventricosus]
MTTHTLIMLLKPRQLLEQFKWEVSDHPAYSLVSAMSNFRLFLELKKWLGGRSFQNNEEIQSNFKAHLASKARTFFEEGKENLFHRYEKFLNLHCDFVEK